MLISLNWIREHCPFKSRERPQRIAERFSLATAEVEDAYRRGEYLPKIVAGRVESVVPISGSGSNSVVQVKIGKGELVTVVCGAPNVREGMCAPFAGPGVRLPKSGRRVRRETKPAWGGVVSQGTLCSEDELGITDSADGLMELPPGTAPGTSLTEIYPDLEDTLLEIDNKSLTHRPDLWGHYGIAREFSTIYGVPIRPYPADESLAEALGDPEVVVSIEEGMAGERCRRYCGLRIDGVRVGPSPEWLRHRLYAVGSRPINNIVDITNFVLFDLGQPLHAFDTEKIRGGRIIVRMPRKGEQIELLDGRTVELTDEDLLIADGEDPVALAGVMGGGNSEISQGTTSIFLESANFDPASVRRTSIRHGRTESSARFEKSLDPVQARQGILRAARMVLDMCPGARVVGSLQDVGFEPAAPIVVEVAPRFISERLGARVSTKRVREILTGLGFRVEETARGDGESGESRGAGKARRGTIWSVEVPSWRATRDVSIREDLLEEVGRIYGYGRVEPFAPQWPVTAPPVNERRRLERQVKNHLSLHCGLREVLTYSMVGARHCRDFGLDPDTHLRLKNPMSEDMDRMRREIIPIHLEKVRDNQRFFDRFGIYEVGRVYRKEPERLLDSELPEESTRVAGVVSFPEKHPDNFYQVRHMLVSLLECLQLDAPEVEPQVASPAWAHTGVGARLLARERDLGSFYRVHPEIMRRLELKGEVLAFDIDFDALVEAPRRAITYRSLPRFPDMPFDVAVVVPERTPVRDIAGVIQSAAGPALRTLEVFDVYQGTGVPSGKKSVALHMIFRADDHTLTAEETDSLQNAVISGLEQAGFPLRE